MADRKTVNKYYPPDWDPSKGSINQYVGQHPLRDRAKKLGQGILVIRFELPYNIWCGGCNNPIGMGVRYNAEKSKVGKYYTTPIYKFRMKCHLCDNYFEIQTDPKNHDYVIQNGARRKEQRWDPKENEQVVTEDKAVQKKMVLDPMYKLEHGSDDAQRGRNVVRTLGELEVGREQYKDDYILNQLARSRFREEKKVIKASNESDKALLTKSSLDITLVPESEDDVKIASLLKYRTVASYDEKQKQLRQSIESRPLFSAAKATKPESIRSHSSSSSSSSGDNLPVIDPRTKLEQSLRKKRTNPFDTASSWSSSIDRHSSLGIKRADKRKRLSETTGSTSIDILHHNVLKYTPKLLVSCSNDKVNAQNIQGVSQSSVSSQSDSALHKVFGAGERDIETPTTHSPKFYDRQTNPESFNPLYSIALYGDSDEED